MVGDTWLKWEIHGNCVSDEGLEPTLYKEPQLYIRSSQTP